MSISVPAQKLNYTLLQHKRVTELHASLALPLVTNASLSFLKRHLALSAQQHALIDESVAANSARLESFESVLAKAEAEVGTSITFLLTQPMRPLRNLSMPWCILHQCLVNL